MTDGSLETPSSASTSAASTDGHWAADLATPMAASLALSEAATTVGPSVRDSACCWVSGWDDEMAAGWVGWMAGVSAHPTVATTAFSWVDR